MAKKATKKKPANKAANPEEEEDEVLEDEDANAETDEEADAEGAADEDEETGETLDLDDVETEVAEAFDEAGDLEREFRAAEMAPDEMEDIIEDRNYVVPFARVRAAPRQKRAKRAMELLKRFAVRHMKPDELLITQEVNERIWERGIKKPPRKLRVRMTKNTDGLVTIYLAD